MIESRNSETNSYEWKDQAQDSVRNVAFLADTLGVPCDSLYFVIGLPKAGDIRKHMKKLRELGLVEYDESTCLYTLPNDFESRLFEFHIADTTHHTDLPEAQEVLREGHRAFKTLYEIKSEEGTVG
jgi:hypothetical protein